MSASLLLKWGTLKGWDGITDAKSRELLQKYFDLGVSMSAILQHDTTEQRQILCDLIRSHTGTIHNDWDGKEYTQEQAVDYVMNYDKPETS